AADIPESRHASHATSVRRIGAVVKGPGGPWGPSRRRRVYGPPVASWRKGCRSRGRWSHRTNHRGTTARWTLAGTIEGPERARRSIRATEPAGWLCRIDSELDALRRPGSRA